MIQQRGYAGTAILWKNSVDHAVEPIEDGSHRVCAVRISATDRQLILINSYMPTQGADKAKSDYDEILDEIHEIMVKYSDHSLIWTGDINASTNREHPTSNDKKFRKLCQEDGLRVCPLQSDQPTFHHFNGSSTSRIDLFIQRRNDEFICKADTHAREATNTGPHDPVTAYIAINIPTSSTPKQHTEKVPAMRIKWEKVDKSQYRLLTQARLNALILNMDEMPDCVIADRLNSILTKCAMQSYIPL